MPFVAGKLIASNALACMHPMVPIVTNNRSPGSPGPIEQLQAVLPTYLRAISSGSGPYCSVSCSAMLKRAARAARLADSSCAASSERSAS